MNIIFLNSEKTFLTEWYDYPHIPNVGDEVVLTIYSESDNLDKWHDSFDDSDDEKLVSFTVKRRQWKEDETVLLIVEITDNK